VQEPRPAAAQRHLLAETIRSTAQWRRRKADQFRDDEEARRGNARAAAALRRLANFVEALPDDDPDLSLYALCRTAEKGGRLELAEDGSVFLSRFGLNQGTWQSSAPTEDQMRNVLRRLDGFEARERRARKERAEQGYGED
jgi:hypothetical protein